MNKTLNANSSNSNNRISVDRNVRPLATHIIDKKKKIRMCGSRTNGIPSRSFLFFNYMVCYHRNKKNATATQTNMQFFLVSASG